MKIKQMTVEDWEATLLVHPDSEAQETAIRARMSKGLPLATWEQNYLSALRQVRAARAAAE